MKVLSILTAIVCLVFSVSTVDAQEKPATDLPNISVIGNMVGTAAKGSKSSFQVREIELAFQHYLYPSVKADIFAAFHKESNGTTAVELEEAYVTFSDLFGVVISDDYSGLGFSAIIGKKLVGIGKINPLHPEQWTSVDKPLAVQQFLGGDEGLSGEGGQLSYLLPLPFFAELTGGYWTQTAHTETEAHTNVEYQNPLITTRLWTGFELSNDKELEVGVSGLFANQDASADNKKQTLVGVDARYYMPTGAESALLLGTELYSARYADTDENPNEELKTQTGGYVELGYAYSKHYDIGLRYDWLGQHGDEGSDKNQIAIYSTKQLTDTAKFRLQYNTGEGVTDTVYAQFIFGMGPHAHVLN